MDLQEQARRCWRVLWPTTPTAPSSGCLAQSWYRSTLARGPAWSESSLSWPGQMQLQQKSPFSGSITESLGWECSTQRTIEMTFLSTNIRSNCLVCKHTLSARMDNGTCSARQVQMQLPFRSEHLHQFDSPFYAQSSCDTVVRVPVRLWVEKQFAAWIIVNALVTCDIISKRTFATIHAYFAWPRWWQYHDLTPVA